MIKFVAFLLLGFLLDLSVARPSKVDKAPLWRDCGKNANRPFRVSKFDIHPYPIKMPGKVNVTLEADNIQTLDGLKLELLVERHIWANYYMTLPCVQDQGSCTYEDLCDYLKNIPAHAEYALQKVQDMFEAGGTPLECPLRNGTIKVTNHEETLPEIPSFVNYVAAGRYRLTARFLEPGTNWELGCFRLNVKVETAEVEVEEDDEAEEECWFWC